MLRVSSQLARPNLNVDVDAMSVCSHWQRSLSQVRPPTAPIR